MTVLTGAAKTAHERKVILDAARRAIARRDPEAVRDTLALLTAAASVTP
mgnify:CR=1 FL=1